MPGLTKRIKDFLYYNATEQRGLVVLFVLLLMVIIGNISLPLFFRDKPQDFSEFILLVEEFERQRASATDSIRMFPFRQNDQSQATADHINPFYFDPNELSEEDWKRLGLSVQQIAVIKNFESKGGRFRSPDDLGRIYSISSAEFEALKPYITVKTEKGHPAKPLQPFLFDPNTVTAEELITMGLDEKLAGTILNYRSKGGQFRTASDLKNIYGMQESNFQALEPYIRIEGFDQLPPEDFPESYTLMIDLNSADTLDLQQLKGIGPSFANRIVKYREMLGGYHRKEQLMEVFGMDSTRYSGIEGNILIQTDYIQKININTSTLKELMAHPYIEFYLAKSIIEHRSAIGKYSRLEELLDARLIYEELFNKIAPYLTY